MDEQQLEVSKSLVKWKKFSAKEDATVWAQDNPGWYGVVERNGAYFMWSSVVMDVYQEATAEVSKIFKLNVPLAIDPAIGLNWKDCH